MQVKENDGLESQKDNPEIFDNVFANAVLLKPVVFGSVLSVSLGTS